jgi:hypothetical protein
MEGLNKVRTAPGTQTAPTNNWLHPAPSSGCALALPGFPGEGTWMPELLRDETAADKPAPPPDDPTA